MLKHWIMVVSSFFLLLFVVAQNDTQGTVKADNAWLPELIKIYLVFYG